MSHKADFIAGKKDLLNEGTKETIDRWVAKFPPEHKRSALIQALLAAQEQNGGWVNDDMIEAGFHACSFPVEGLSLDRISLKNTFCVLVSRYPSRR